MRERKLHASYLSTVTTKFALQDQLSSLISLYIYTHISHTLTSQHNFGGEGGKKNTGFQATVSSKERMASMIAGNLVDAYVLKNAAREKIKRAGEASAGDDAAKKGGHGAGAGNKTPEGSKEKRGSFFGLAKKVHPKVDQGGASS
jgi:hypothetical protein